MEKKYKNIIEAAQARGSTAKTKSGAWKYLLKNLATTPDCPRNSSQYDWDRYRTARINRSADGRAAILGYTDKSPAWIDYCAAYEEHAARETAKKNWAQWQSQAITLTDAITRTYQAAWNCGHTKISISSIIAVVAWDETADWGYYSKRYNRPKNTYSNRRVDFYQKIAGIITVIYSVHVDSFRGEFLRSAIIEAGQKLARPELIEVTRALPLRREIIAQRVAEEQKIPKTCYKCVAVSDGKYISIFDGKTAYNIGEVVHDNLRVCSDYDDICGYGGIFVHATQQRAEKQDFPDNSAAQNLPRVTVRGEYWGKTNVNGKIAAEYFRAVEVCA